MVDTGGGYFMGVDNPVAINNAIGANYNKTLDEFIVNCNNISSLPLVELQISGQPFSLSGSEYITRVIYNRIVEYRQSSTLLRLLVLLVIRGKNVD